MKGWSRQWLLMFALALALPATASDQAREQRMAEQIEDAILVGEPIRLQAEGHEFLAIQTEADGQRRGSVVLLHGTGVHPDWPDVIYPLRSELPAAGWETLSIQLPVAAADAGYDQYLPLFPEARQRIDAAVAFLSERGAGPVFVLGHSLGATMGASYLASGASHAGEVAGFIAVGIAVDPGQIKSGTLDDLADIDMPVLDIYGSEDLEAVLASVPARAEAAAKAANSSYRQIEVDGANHFFNDRDDPLLEAVNTWLEQTTNE